MNKLFFEGIQGPNQGFKAFVKQTDLPIIFL
jgi:hypothetical protein